MIAHPTPADLLLRKLNRCLNMRFSTMKFKLLIKVLNSRAMGDDVEG